MLLTRAVEERGKILARQGRIPGGFYTGRGNEAATVGAAAAMDPDDVGAPLHRSLGVHLGRGVEVWRVFAQYFGRIDGPARGRDNSLHIGSPESGLIAMTSHLPAMLPVAVGAALAFRITGQPRVALAWFGDGASARGDTHEGMNFAAVQHLPVVFLCENNQYAYSTPASLNYAVDRLASRAAAYGFRGHAVDGTDVLAVYEAVRAAIDAARAGGGPSLVELETMRMDGHAMHDDASYVPADLMARWASKDPVEQFRERLRSQAGLTPEEEDALDASVKQEVDDGVVRALKSPEPDPTELLLGVYAQSPASPAGGA